MYKVVYDIIDFHGVNYVGEFQTIHKNPREITIKLKEIHKKIELPFKETNVKVYKA